MNGLRAVRDLEAKTRALALTALVGLGGLGAPGALGAQQTGGEDGWWRWAAAELLAGQEVRTADGRVVVIDREGRRDRGRRDRGRRDRDRFGRGDDARGGRGPAFCRSGEGHPVFGRDWCRRKGFGLGSVRWRRGGFEDVIFRRDRDRRVLDRRGIEDVLGEIILGRLLERSGAERRAGALRGRWLDLRRPDGRALQLRAGDRPLAELSDLDGDGRVDVVLWNAEVSSRRRPPG